MSGIKFTMKDKFHMEYKDDSKESIVATRELWGFGVFDTVDCDLYSHTEPPSFVPFFGGQL